MTHTSSVQTGSPKVTTSCVQAHCWVTSGHKTKGEKGHIFDAKTEWLKFSFNKPTYAPHQMHINSQDITPNYFDKNTPSSVRHGVQSANVKNAFLGLVHCTPWWPDDGVFLTKHAGKKYIKITCCSLWSICWYNKKTDRKYTDWQNLKLKYMLSVAQWLGQTSSFSPIIHFIRTCHNANCMQ